MTTLVADKNARSELSPAEEAVLDRFLRLRPTQQERVSELLKLYRDAGSEEERAEIGQALGEILFRAK